MLLSGNKRSDLNGQGNPSVARRGLAEKSVFLGFGIAVIFLAVLMAEGQVPQKDGENLVFRNHKGSLRKTNPEGGFIVDRLSGDANLKANGTIRVSQVNGNLVATTSAGDIEIRDVGGSVTAITQAGNINIERAKRHVYAEAELGEIILRGADSTEIQNVFGGDVKIFNVTGVTKVTTKGNILLVVPESNTAKEICNLSSTEGDITIYLPEGTAADIDIRMPLSEDSKHESRIESDFSFSQFRQKCDTGNILTMSTKINEGGRKILLYIEKGNIYFKILKPEMKKSSGLIPG